MLRTMLYKGLRQDVEYISGHLYLSIIDFDELRVEIQKIETEHPVQSRSMPKPAIIKSGILQAASTFDTYFEDL